jgi:hypothetical protein
MKNLFAAAAILAAATLTSIHPATANTTDELALEGQKLSDEYDRQHPELFVPYGPPNPVDTLSVNERAACAILQIPKINIITPGMTPERFCAELRNVVVSTLPHDALSAMQGCARSARILHNRLHWRDDQTPVPNPMGYKLVTGCFMLVLDIPQEKAEQMINKASDNKNQL